MSRLIVDDNAIVEMTLDSAAGDVSVDVGDNVRGEIAVTAGEGEVEFTVPEGAAVFVTLAQDTENVDLPERFILADDADLTITLNGLAGNFTIR